jgi:hypothetical protein
LVCAAFAVLPFCTAAEEDIVVSEVEAPVAVEEQVVEVGEETPADKQ